MIKLLDFKNYDKDCLGLLKYVTEKNLNKK